MRVRSNQMQRKISQLSKNLSALALMTHTPTDEKTRFCAFLDKRARRQVRFLRRQPDEGDVGSDASASETEEPPISAAFASLSEAKQQQFLSQGIYARDLKEALAGMGGNFSIEPRQVVIFRDGTE